MGLHIGGWLSGRYTPIHIYGPTGSIPELGTKAFVDGMSKGYAWDLATRTGALPDAGAQIKVHEFDYKQENKVVYEKNGVTIRSWPAIHSLDGSVSYGLEWNGLKYVFGGDTYPNKWYIKYTANADIASHEAFLPPKALATYFGWDLTQATYVSTRIHSEPQAFGKVMSAVKPRLAVGYHSVQSPENNAAIMDGVRKTYDGPLALARDLMVINVTKDINFFTWQPIINYNLSDGWYLAAVPIITANWEASSDDRWTVPIGGKGSCHLGESNWLIKFSSRSRFMIFAEDRNISAGLEVLTTVSANTPDTSPTFRPI